VSFLFEYFPSTPPGQPRQKEPETFCILLTPLDTLLSGEIILNSLMEVTNSLLRLSTLANKDVKLLFGTDAKILLCIFCNGGFSIFHHL